MTLNIYDKYQNLNYWFVYLQVEGIVRDYTFNGLELHDGCYYDITLQSCNGARLCSRSQILNILVDGSPPTPGKASLFVQ